MAQRRSRAAALSRRSEVPVQRMLVVLVRHLRRLVVVLVEPVLVRPVMMLMLVLIHPRPAGH